LLLLAPQCGQRLRIFSPGGMLMRDEEVLMRIEMRAELARLDAERARLVAEHAADLATIAEQVSAAFATEAARESEVAREPEVPPEVAEATGGLAATDREAARIAMLASIEQAGGQMPWERLYDVVRALGYADARVLGGMKTAGLLTLIDEEDYALTDLGRERLEQGRHLLSEAGRSATERATTDSHVTKAQAEAGALEISLRESLGEPVDGRLRRIASAAPTKQGGVGS
jgi:hypothetical protein